MTGSRVLCVAEKPAIAKAVAQHLSGGVMQTIPTGSQYVKNYVFEFNFGRPWGNCSVTMTSVLGHLTTLDFERQYKGWLSCPPGALFEAPVHEFVDSTVIEKGNILELRFANKQKKATLVLPLNVPDSAILNERAHVLSAARALIDLDDLQVNAVAARIELDLRIGAAFTRLQCLQLKPLSETLSDTVISYGSCQFPTLGFVVDRYLRVKNFKPEKFWGIKVMHNRDGIKVNFLWRRIHLFDRAAVTVMLERCLMAQNAKVTKVNQKPTSKWRPLPLTTVDLQMMGNQFDKGIDLKKLIEKQLPDGNWGQYARGAPRAGRHNDQAHPPIHPICWVAPSALSADEKKVYEFVVRRFLACCAEDAKGQTSEVEIQYGDETFHAKGLIVLERNYLDVYVYDKWESTQQLPEFRMGEFFEPAEANIFDGTTTPPNYLTEPELIGLMDANGIGTDATMAEHIAKIKEREYVAVNSRGSGRNAVKELIPTRLGIALVEGYDNVFAGLPDSPSLSKPFLRKEMELRMREICTGSKSRQQVVQENLEKYREVFIHTQRRINLLKDACRKYIVEGAT
ncbi:hypothetical protein EYZ11_009237 [Aspergillus tanneri]|uniref:DNA topoisomerase n=1 Tax=Aspergillus tanneri TaxID=1220188 RepID=A0A4S3J8F0_9EURO|nr:hypothetical protein EYZ11_009237 [Aspergillus tanneri]